MATLVEEENPKTSELNEWELEVATKVFRSFETGLREGTEEPIFRILEFILDLGWEEGYDNKIFKFNQKKSF